MSAPFKLVIQGYDERTADFDGPYRYSLTRAWSPSPRRALVLGCNPSKAGALKNDQTISRSTQLVRDAGYDGFVMMNLFSWCATHPKDLRRAAAEGHDVVGPETDARLKRAIANAPVVIAAWGSLDWAEFEMRVQTVCLFLQQAGKHLSCFGLTKDGAPRHPSRLPRSAKLEHYAP